jgi:hypothetical protein
MKFFPLVLIVAMFFSSCARHEGYCVGEPEPFELSPSHLNEYGIRLASISNSGLVKIQCPDGEFAYARTGESFEHRDGSNAGFYRLRSVDISSGHVIIEGMRFVMYSR